LRKMLCCSFVEDGTRGVKQSCGAFDGTLEPGLAWYCCPLQTISQISVKVSQLDVSTDTKTQDNVTVSVRTAVLYQVNEDMVEEAYFRLNNVQQQVTAYVDDVVRSELPQLALDQAYESKSKMSNEVHKTLQEAMGVYGLIIKKVLITDLQPDSKVILAMNEINTQKRQRAALQEKAEADKILKVKEAEADMESKHLAGVGVAKMRMAITNGCKESIESMTTSVGLAPQDVVHMMLVTQYLDTLKDFAATGRSAVMVPNGGTNGGGSMEEQMRAAVVTSGMLSAPPPPPPQR